MKTVCGVVFERALDVAYGQGLVRLRARTIERQERLTGRNMCHAARVVSMPSWELFDDQPKDYRDQVLPPSLRARVSVEAGTTKGWERYVGLDGASVGMSSYGASAPAGVLYEKFDITAERVAREARNLVNGGS